MLEVAEEMTNHKWNMVKPVLPLILYICSEGADIIERKSTNRNQKTSEPRELDTGYQIGHTLCSYRTKYQGASDNKLGGTVQPNIRRAEWHSYWTGKRDVPEERKLIIKWVAPTMVDDRDDVIPTIRDEKQ